MWKKKDCLVCWVIWFTMSSISMILPTKLTDFLGNFVDTDGQNSAVSNIMNLQVSLVSIALNHSVTVEAICHCLQHSWLLSLLLILSRNALITTHIPLLEGLTSQHFVFVFVFFFSSERFLKCYFPADIKLGTTPCFSVCFHRIVVGNNLILLRCCFI